MSCSCALCGPPLAKPRNNNCTCFFSFPSSLSHPTLSDDLLAALTMALKSTPFDFQGAQILSSLDKEAFNWIAVNYVLENFFKVKDDPAWEVQN